MDGENFICTRANVEKSNQMIFPQVAVPFLCSWSRSPIPSYNRFSPVPTSISVEVHFTHAHLQFSPYRSGPCRPGCRRRRYIIAVKNILFLSRYLHLHLHCAGLFLADDEDDGIQVHSFKCDPFCIRTKMYVRWKQFRAMGYLMLFSLLFSLVNFTRPLFLLVLTSFSISKIVNHMIQLVNIGFLNKPVISSLSSLRCTFQMGKNLLLS